MNNIKAVIFDADGTLFDSFELIVAAYTHVSVTHNLPIPQPDMIRSQLGRPLIDMFRTFYPDQDLQQLLETNDRFFSINVLKSKSFEGVAELLDQLTANGMKVAILTSGTSTVHNVLAQHNLTKYFTSVVHAKRVVKSKPDPEGYLLACRECDVDPFSTIMVGDTIYDIETGKNAGAGATIAFTHGYGIETELLAAKPTYIAHSIFEVGRIITDNSR
jgi:HAD superfamily hydrolase (TIGR01549 family)